ncbi:MAG: ATP synthase F1 subunit epsilon [Puniceicoccales bacterium]|jgi:F-type H+-transporting ATPase subunit epsilon|nr:ATP synthase F1 subunit epsilon [Puniceicoccales bacterium]
MAVRLEIVTPEGTVLERAVDSVTVPTESGEVGILPGHIPLAAIVIPGLLHFATNGKRESIAVDRGFLLLQSDVLAVTVDGAIDVANIDAEEATKAKKRAEEALEEAKKSHMDREEIAQLEAQIRYQLIKKRAREMAP